MKSCQDEDKNPFGDWIRVGLKVRASSLCKYVVNQPKNQKKLKAFQDKDKDPLVGD